MAEQKERQQKHVSLAQQLQDELLQTYLNKLRAGELSDTGMAALQRLLMENGWDFDPSRTEGTLEDHLVDGLDPDEEDDGTIPFPLRNRA